MTTTSEVRVIGIRCEVEGADSAEWAGLVARRCGLMVGRVYPSRDEAERLAAEYMGTVEVETWRAADNKSAGYKAATPRMALTYTDDLTPTDDECRAAYAQYARGAKCEPADLTPARHGDRYYVRAREYYRAYEGHEASREINIAVGTCPAGSYTAVA